MENNLPIPIKTSTKVSRAIGAATSVNANCWAIVTYIYTSYAVSTNASYPVMPSPTVDRTFGPGQPIPLTFTVGLQNVGSGTGNGTFTYTLLSGVEFINEG